MNMENRTWEYVSVFIMSWLLVYGLTPFIIKLAKALNFVDKPEARKIHLTSVPYMGGLSVFIGFFLLCIYDVTISANRSFDPAMLGYLGGSLLIMLIGLIDDRFGMNPIIKLIGQITVSLLFILTNFQFSELRDMFGSVYISLPVMVLWMVGLMNALNFLDNMDGILSGIAGILGLGFFCLQLGQHHWLEWSGDGFHRLDIVEFRGQRFGLSALQL